MINCNWYVSLDTAYILALIKIVLLGAFQSNKIPKIRVNYGRGWSDSGGGGGGVLTCWSSISCVFCLYTLLKGVSHYELTVLSMSVMGFQKKFGWGVGRWGELYPVLFWIF